MGGGKSEMINKEKLSTAMTESPKVYIGLALLIT